MKNPFYRAEESLGYMTITAHRLLNSILRRKFKQSNIELTPEQWGILVLLWELGSATQDDLANLLCVDKSSMSRVLSLMEEKGYITRQIDSSNERKKIICATEKSVEVREAGFAIANEALKSSLKGVKPHEAQICIKVLAAIKVNLKT
jgi:DNA-binding MarR family transcriptional regulator